VFPDGFLWGTATASYQVEGGVYEDGRGKSIWDTFCHTPGRVFHGDTGDIACDHFHRFADDVKLMGSLGLSAYRFSVAWPRIQPEGSGAPNQAGLDFYRRLADSLRAEGIEPAATLYHWDLPQALQDKGGWTDRDTASRFAEYAGLVAEALGEQVRLWITLNEPWVSAFVGYELGQHAPGVRDTRSAVLASHHLLLGHGRAVAALRGTIPATSQIGITLNLYPVHAATDSQEDRAAAARVDAYGNRWFLDPVLLGRYPEELSAIYQREIGGEWTEAGDLQEIHADIDFLGVNYYTTRRVGAAGDGATPTDEGSEVEATASARRPYPRHLGATEVPVAGLARTTKGWAIQPEGLKELLIWLKDQYGDLPLYVTENGAAFADYVDPEGRVHDPERIDYLSSHFKAAEEAIGAGVDLRGYFVWSFLDNFEWADGYSQRFGLVYVDYKSQERIPKSSARFVADVAKANAVPETS
jgi:beta-glucosidase